MDETAKADEPPPAKQKERGDLKHSADDDAMTEPEEVDMYTIKILYIF